MTNGATHGPIIRAGSGIRLVGMVRGWDKGVGMDKGRDRVFGRDKEGGERREQKRKGNGSSHLKVHRVKGRDKGARVREVGREKGENRV